MPTAKIENVPNRVEKAKNLLLYQFKNAPNINALVDVLVTELQELEDVATKMQEVRTLRGAFGVYLDEIGRRLKVPRGNYADNDYKTAIKIAMAKKTSSATAEDILFIARLLTDDDTIELRNDHPYMMELYGFLFCLADDIGGLQALANLFPINTRVRLVQRYFKPFKFNTAGQGFGVGATLNNLAYHRYGNTNDTRFTTLEQVFVPPVQNSAPFSISNPYITGNSVEGSVLIVNDGEWGGDEPIVITYQWLREGADIAAATESTYTATADDKGFNISCKVIATNDYGTDFVITNSIQIEDIVVEPSPMVDNLGLTSSYYRANTPWTNSGAVTATYEIIFVNDGSLRLIENGVTTNGSWLTNVITGAGSDYTLQYSLVSGSVTTSLNAGESRSLANSISFSVSVTASGNMIKSGTLNVTVRNTTDSSILESKEFTLVAEVTDTFH